MNQSNEPLPTVEEIRYKQWQQALKRIEIMRRRLIELGETDPAILGSAIITLRQQPEFIKISSTPTS
jgi:hypothetical protein